MVIPSESICVILSEGSFVILSEAKNLGGDQVRINKSVSRPTVSDTRRAL